MLPIVPEEISGKIKFWNNDVFVKEDIKLSENEQQVFDEFRERLKKSNRERFM